MVIIIANYTSEAEDVAKDWDIDDCNNELIKIKKKEDDHNNNDKLYRCC